MRSHLLLASKVARVAQLSPHNSTGLPQGRFLVGLRLPNRRLTSFQPALLRSNTQLLSAGPQQTRLFCSQSQSGSGGGGGGGDESGPKADGENGAEPTAIAQTPPTIQYSLLTPPAVPEHLSPVPLIAINRHPLFPRFVKVVEVLRHHIFSPITCLFLIFFINF